jgi:hypothetical protein
MGYSYLLLRFLRFSRSTVLYYGIFALQGRRLVKLSSSGSIFELILYVRILYNPDLVYSESHILEAQFFEFYIN